MKELKNIRRSLAVAIVGVVAVAVTAVSGGLGPAATAGATTTPPVMALRPPDLVVSGFRWEDISHPSSTAVTAGDDIVLWYTVTNRGAYDSSISTTAFGLSDQVDFANRWGSLNTQSVGPIAPGQSVSKGYYLHEMNLFGADCVTASHWHFDVVVDSTHTGTDQSHLTSASSPYLTFSDSCIH